MKYIDGFRDPDAAHYLEQQIEAANQGMFAQGRPVRLMEVCGTHTMAIARHGIRDLLPDNVFLLSGPGCPVCVTDAGYIDAAIELARQGCVIATFGDMLKVPGSSRSLAQARAHGARVEVCYSPEMALDLASRHQGSQVVFLAVGFETTVAPVVSLVRSGMERGLDNLSLLTAFKLIPPALEALIADPEVQVGGFICPAHVSAIIGAEAYRLLVHQHGVPCVVAGFEPLDILYGILCLVRQLADGQVELVNQYERVVKPEGNKCAQALMAEYLEPADVVWRGIGTIPASGLRLKDEYASFDAARRFGVETDSGQTDPGCRCGDVLRGKITPRDCGLFGKRCTPDQPVGPCMVSAEGSCAAYYKYLR